MYFNESQLGCLSQQAGKGAIPIGPLRKLRALAAHSVFDATRQDSPVAFAL